MIINNNLELTPKIAKMLKDGKVGAIATDTVYGLVCDASNKIAIDKIVNLKNRDLNKSFVIFAKNLDFFSKIAKIHDNIKKIANIFWPGALTIVAKKQINFAEFIDKNISNNQNIALRIPDNSFFIKLLDEFNGFLVVTSANISKKDPALNVKQIKRYFANNLDFIVEGSDFSSCASTIVEFEDDRIKILRSGDIKKQELLKYL